VGDAAFAARARRLRKMLGGGMRQAGIAAAAGIIALEEMRHRLAEDHANARRLAEGLAALPGIELDPETVQTNIVLFRVVDERFTWQTFIAAAEQHGVRVGELGHGRIRAVTHRGISAADIEHVLKAFASVLRHGPQVYIAERAS
jgi:threonine aldolase